MGDEFDLGNILEQDEINGMFDDLEDEVTIDNSDEDVNNEENNDETTETIDSDKLFDEESEGVGSEKEDINIEEGEETEPDEGNGTSPKAKFYSSIAKALKEEGVFPDLDDDDTKSIKTPSDFLNIIEKQIQEKFDERQKRIDDALNAGVEISEIKKYENTLNFLNSIDDNTISDESDKGEKLRQQLIFQDYINRGYSKERAQKEVQKSFNAGTDIEDAKDALDSNKDFFKKEYKSLVDSAKLEEEKAVNERKEQAEKLKKSIMDDDKLFGELKIDKGTRAKIYDNISKPVYKDPETGDFLTAIQKYEMENRTEFLKNVGLIFTLTNGFKNLDNLLKGKVKKEVNKGIRELERVLNNTAIPTNGNLKYMVGVDDDPESYLGKGWKLDIQYIIRYTFSNYI